MQEEYDIEFAIQGIESGWIFAQLSTPNECVQMCNSYLGGLQMPCAMFQSMNDLLDLRQCERCVCWHGESNSYIWRMRKEPDHFYFEIYEGGCSFSLPAKSDALEKMYTHVSRLIAVETAHDFLIHTICNAFKPYTFGKGLEIWQQSSFRDTFPKEEYSQLRRKLRSMGYH